MNIANQSENTRNLIAVLASLPLAAAVLAAIYATTGALG